MTIDNIKHIIAKGEGIDIEFKESQNSLTRSVFSSICAFLNRRGGHIFLGVSDNGEIVGINPSTLKQQLDTLAKDMNNPQVIAPSFYLNFETYEIEGKSIIYFYVPESPQPHTYKGTYYDRNQDGDFELKNTKQVTDLCLRKQTGSTENRVLPYLAMSDLDAKSFDRVRKLVKVSHSNHPWSEMSNEEILRSAGLWMKDMTSGQEGYTVAAALLFGTEQTLRSVVPFYKIDALCRKMNTILYDDRDIITCNLVNAYERLMQFVQRHLPEMPYIDGIQRISLRDTIFRELCLNLLIHREYGNHRTATLTIYKDRVESDNWNIPFNYGLVNPDNVTPHAKNPAIANVFVQMGLVEELGSGVRKIFKYTPLYSGGKQPVIEEDDIFKIFIPYIGQETGQENQETGKETGKEGQETGKETGQESQETGKENILISSPVKELLDIIGEKELSVKEMMKLLNLKGSDHFRKSYLHPAIEAHLVEMTHPENPKHRNQKYRVCK